MITLVKTTGGNNGAPIKCHGCGGLHFAKSGIAWHCTMCGIYHPTKLGFESLKQNLKQLEVIKNKLTFIRQQLEHITKE